MENYFSDFLLVSELDDPVYFARIHQEIYELEKQQVALFNTVGPLSWDYIVTTSELNMAYMEAGDTRNEVTTAQQIYQGTVALEGEGSERSIEALLALGSSLLDDGRIREAQTIAAGLLRKDPFSSDADNSYDYLAYLDSLCLQADIYRKTKQTFRERPIREKVLDAYNTLNGEADDQSIMARAALATCLERKGLYEKALEHYVVIKSYLDIEKDLATDAERIGLMVHIADCYRKTGKIEDSKTVIHWAMQDASTLFGPESSLLSKMHGFI
jgi:tetratricopeptide (TPR) repeat protein